MENSIKIRIQKLMELEQLNPASFAKAIQVNPSAISHILNDRNKPSTDIIIKILNTFRSLNSDWLMLGIGSMYRNEKATPIHTQTSSLFDSIPEIETNMVRSEPLAPYNVVSIEQASEEVVEKEAVTEKQNETLSQSAKTLKKIIVYYSDNSFEEFFTSK